MKKNLTKIDMETKDVISRKRYKFGNKNKRIEKEYIKGILSKSDLPEEQKFYLKSRYLDSLFALDKLAIENKAVFQVARSIVLIIGVLIPAIVNIDNSIIPDQTSKIIVTVLSVFSSVLFGVLQIWKHDLVWAHHRLQFELMRSELYRFLTLSGENYESFTSHKEAFKKFATIAEDKFDLEVKTYFNILQLGSKSQLLNNFENTESIEG